MRLSIGARQRVALAALPLAGAPTARLESNARAVGFLFADLTQRMKTVIVCASHDPALLDHAATEVAPVMLA